MKHSQDPILTLIVELKLEDIPDVNKNTPNAANAPEANTFAKPLQDLPRPQLNLNVWHSFFQFQICTSRHRFFFFQIGTYLGLKKAPNDRGPSFMRPTEKVRLLGHFIVKGLFSD